MNITKDKQHMNAITVGLLDTLRSEDQIVAYSLQLRQMRDLDLASREAVQDSPEQDAMIAELEELNDLAQEACSQIITDLLDSGINATSACGEGGDFVIELMTPAGVHAIAGCQL